MKIDNPFENQESQSGIKFSTFRGVFRPTVLTILGVMIFLREGWVVGNAGLLGAFLIILLCFAITGMTVLAVASIATNVRIRSGGVFSLVSQSLGLEVGGAIGVPLYLAQGLSAALYIHGFSSGWVLLFPEHNLNYVLGGFWLVAVSFCYISTNFVFRIQALTFFLVLISILALVFNNIENASVDNIVLWGDFSDGNIWYLFAVFFPAATGVLVGVSMSGSLKNSRHSIPRGALASWGFALIVYLVIAVCYSLKFPTADLKSNLEIGISGGWLAKVASLGLLVSCSSATLSSLVSAPKVLQALGSYGVVSSRFGFQKQNKKGDSTRSLLFTALIVLITIYLADLNSIASLLTIFFILTYFFINIVLLIEKVVNMVSFRPEFSLPVFFPLMGSLLCLVAILLISPLFGLFTIFFVLALYFYLTTKQLKAPWETVNSGLLLGLVNWATKRLQRDSQFSLRAWRPDLLIPIYSADEMKSSNQILQGLVSLRGSALFVEFFDEGENKHSQQLQKIIKEWKKTIYVNYSKVQSPNFYYGLRSCLSLKSCDVLSSNIMFANVNYKTDEEVKMIFDVAKEYSTTSLFFCTNEKKSVKKSTSNVVNLWVRDQSPDWSFSLQSTNLDCQILLGYLLQESLGVKVRLITVVADKKNIEVGEKYLNQLVSFARISKNTEIVVAQGTFDDYIKKVPASHLNLFGLGDFVSKEFMVDMTTKLNTPCLFLKESGKESALV